MEVYRRMHSDSTPSLVYGLTSTIAAVTIGSMGVHPPMLRHTYQDGRVQSLILPLFY